MNVLTTVFISHFELSTGCPKKRNATLNINISITMHWIFQPFFFLMKRDICKFWIQSHFWEIQGNWNICRKKLDSKQINSFLDWLIVAPRPQKLAGDTPTGPWLAINVLVANEHPTDWKDFNVFQLKQNMWELQIR